MRHGDLFIVQQLLAAKADVEVHTAVGCTPLRVEKGHTAIVAELINAGVNVNAAGIGRPYRKSISAGAAAAGNISGVQSLLDAGANGSILGGSDDALQAAAEASRASSQHPNSLAVLKLLLSKLQDVPYADAEAVLKQAWQTGCYKSAAQLMLYMQRLERPPGHEDPAGLVSNSQFTRDLTAARIRLLQAWVADTAGGDAAVAAVIAQEKTGSAIAVGARALAVCLAASKKAGAGLATAHYL